MSAADYMKQGVSFLQNFLKTGSAGETSAEHPVGHQRLSPSSNVGQGDRNVRGFLSKNESFLVTLQKIVLWENAALSSIFLTCFTLTYWFLASMRPLGLLFEALLVYYCYVILYDFGWKSICLNPTEEQTLDRREADEWTLMEQSAFSAPELQVALVKVKTAAKRYVEMFLTLRKEQPRNYAIMLLGIFSTTAFVGSLVSGPVLLYALSLFVFTAPGLIHNSVQLNQLFWNMICGSDPSPEADKHVDEFMWKASREDLHLLEKAATTTPVSGDVLNGDGSSDEGSPILNEQPIAVSKDSSESGSIVDDTMEKIGHDDLQFGDEDDASSFEEYDPGEFPSLEVSDSGAVRRSPRH